eukprot:CAMPEP_0113314274 /NCGR_PEP_ID=MMETSP0010_2-20120614/10396_1 /TAXON_ID=216773 ORGANISM="Corethron hystrix, Strain 308" /NCGR_SAMPLE_ID=MMETSP0010_2 /ASSEMBLY_ACC=CAM_ASM_000155 /LENGTH=75 /DNA_ID=CAMNT_0000170519 /DNA_START=54 /DNA_END=281 /DNA_ORIENTATION=- /assembly_acc=CAM_ASM_000155
MPPLSSASRGISVGPALAIVLSTGLASAAIFYGHFGQVRDKREMRAGVDRDRARLKEKAMMRKRQIVDEEGDRQR